MARDLQHRPQDRLCTSPWRLAPDCPSLWIRLNTDQYGVHAARHCTLSASSDVDWHGRQAFRNIWILGSTEASVGAKGRLVRLCSIGRCAVHAAEARFTLPCLLCNSAALLDGSLNDGKSHVISSSLSCKAVTSMSSTCESAMAMMKAVGQPRV